MIRILIFIIPLFFIYLFINEYLKQKKAAEENWNNQWEEKKKNFQKEKEIIAKEKEILKLKQKLKDEKQDKELKNPNTSDFSNNKRIFFSKENKVNDLLTGKNEFLFGKESFNFRLRSLKVPNYV